MKVTKVMGARVLVVEPNPKVRSLINGMLTKSGYDTSETGEAAGAQALLTEFKPDVVLSDVATGEVSGFDLCRRIKKPEGHGIGNGSGGAPPPIVFLLASDGKLQTEAAAIQAGADAFLKKPFNPQALLDLLASHLKARDELAAQLQKLIELDVAAAQLLETNEALSVEGYKPKAKDLAAFTERLQTGIDDEKRWIEEEPLKPRVRLAEGPLTDEELEVARKEREEDLAKVDQTQGELGGGKLSAERIVSLVRQHNSKRKRATDKEKKDLVDRLVKDYQAIVRREELVEVLRKEGLACEDFYGASYLYLAFDDLKLDLYRRKEVADQARYQNQEIHGLFSKKLVEREEDIAVCARIDQEIAAHGNVLKLIRRAVETHYWALYLDAAMHYRGLRQAGKDSLWLKIFLRYGFVSNDERVSPPGTMDILIRALQRTMAEPAHAQPGDPKILYFDEYISALEFGAPTPTGLSPSVTGLDGDLTEKEVEALVRMEDKWRKWRMNEKETIVLRQHVEGLRREREETEKKLQELEARKTSGSLSAEEEQVLRRGKGSLGGLQKNLEKFEVLLNDKGQELAVAKQASVEEETKFVPREYIARDVNALRVRTRQCSGENFPLGFVKSLSEKALLASRKDLLEFLRKIETRNTRIMNRGVAVNFRGTGLTMRDGFTLILGLPTPATTGICLGIKDNREEGRLFIPMQVEENKRLDAFAEMLGQFIFQSNAEYDETLVYRPKERDDKQKEKEKIMAGMAPRKLEEDFRMWLSYAKSQQRKNVGNEHADAVTLEKKPVDEFTKRYVKYLKKTLDATSAVTWEFDLRLQALFDIYVT